jgi:hypothetical protein
VVPVYFDFESLKVKKYCEKLGVPFAHRINHTPDPKAKKEKKKIGVQALTQLV